MKELSRSVDNLDTCSETSKPPSIPIYHGSIIHVEQHQDNENTADLTVRVPNFHHVSLPSVSITINHEQSDETDSQREARIKRRAPICPILNGSHHQHQTNDVPTSNLDQSGSTSSKRLAIGLRNLRRAFITNCKSKQSTNVNEITIIPVLPDVEVITENFQKVPSEKKDQKNPSSTSKFLMPKIFFIKRKHSKMKKKQQLSTDSINTQTNTDDSTWEASRADVSMKENENEPNKVDQEGKARLFCPNIHY